MQSRVSESEPTGLTVRSLTKRYSGIPVVNRVSFTIGPGEILGYLGPNGAGKSTTVKMLTGLIAPSEGEILSDGLNVEIVSGLSSGDEVIQRPPREIS